MWRRLVDRLNHEYWPWQLIYLPVLPFYLYQAIRQRRAVFFTNVNPAIDMGGFFGESKWAIYRLLPAGSYPHTIRIEADTTSHDVLRNMHNAGLSFPLIVKPDVGERGDGVVRVNDEHALLRALAGNPELMLMQAMAHGELEFGLMFAKHPGTGRIELLSITGKRFLRVVGDGRRSVRDLLNTTWRGAKQITRLEMQDPGLLDRVPSKGDGVMVEPIGNHCRGTTFCDAGHLRTVALCEAVHDVLKDAQGVNYGRLDVRSESEEALQAGRFSIIELNGVTSEPGHIYDPAYSIFRAWAELLRHVRRLGPISEQVQRAGHGPATLHALVLRCEAHFGWRLGPLRRVAASFA